MFPTGMIPASQYHMGFTGFTNNFTWYFHFIPFLLQLRIYSKVVLSDLWGEVGEFHVEWDVEGSDWIPQWWSPQATKLKQLPSIIKMEAITRHWLKQQYIEYSAPLLTLIQQLYEIGGKPLIFAIGYYGRTALHYACYHDNLNLQVVKFLVQNGGGETLPRTLSVWVMIPIMILWNILSKTEEWNSSHKQNNRGFTALESAKWKGNDSR